MFVNWDTRNLLYLLYISWDSKVHSSFKEYVRNYTSESTQSTIVPITYVSFWRRDLSTVTDSQTSWFLLRPKSYRDSSREVHSPLTTQVSTSGGLIERVSVFLRGPGVLRQDIWTVDVLTDP